MSRKATVLTMCVLARLAFVRVLLVVDDPVPRGVAIFAIAWMVLVTIPFVVRRL